MTTETHHPGRIHIYGVPMDLGQEKRGVDLGPIAIRYAGLAGRLERQGWEVIDHGDMSMDASRLMMRKVNFGGHTVYHSSAIINIARSLHHRIEEDARPQDKVLMLGGDHSASLGSVASTLERPGRAGVIWIDAHGDFNTPQTSPSGNVHGMVVAWLMGRGIPRPGVSDIHLQPDQMCMIAIRDLDPREAVNLEASGINVATIRDVEERGISVVVHDALDRLGDIDSLHVSFDLDSLEPAVAPGVGTPVPGGLTQREALLLAEILGDDGRVTTLDLVEVNPILDEANKTARFAVDIAASLMGERILHPEDV